MVEFYNNVFWELYSCHAEHFKLISNKLLLCPLIYSFSEEIPPTFVHQQAALLCLLLVPLIIGKEDHLESVCVGLRRLQVLAVPLCRHTDCTVVTVIGAFPRFTFNKCLSGKIEIIKEDKCEKRVTKQKTFCHAFHKQMYIISYI